MNIFGRIKLALSRFFYHLHDRFYRILQPNLAEILAAADPAQSLSVRVAWIESLLDWVRRPILPSAERRSRQHIQSARVRFFLSVLDSKPEVKEKVGRVLYSTLLDSDPLNLFCLTGLSRQSGFFSELFDRLARRILPAPRNERDLSELFARIFSHEMDAEWLRRLDPGVFAELYALIAPTQEQQEKLYGHFDVALQDTLIILASQIESLGLSPEIRLRTGIATVRDSAFWSFRVLVADLHSEKKAIVPGDPAQVLLRQAQACRDEVNIALAHLEEQGVSIAIVYRLEQIESYLRRIETLSLLRFGVVGENRMDLWLLLFADLVFGSIESSRLAPLVQDNIHLLARKIVERTGDSGEHYITRTRQEYFSMFVSAVGGGILTTGTAMIKFAITKTYSVPFIEGVFSWLNYSGSFLTMQFMHLTLATKQPSMTAPALAAKLRSLNSRDEVDAFVDEIANLTRSQFIAALGNVGAVLPCAVVTDFVFHLVFGRHILPVEYAPQVLSSLNPFTSLTIPFAALTGVILWVSSLCAGWIENWFAYRRMSVALSESRFVRALVGKSDPARFASWLTQHISGIGGNLSLGFLLAFTPVFGRFFGLGLDVRHVTLSAGSLAFAMAALPAQDRDPWMIGGAVLGVVMIGVLNFGVSFVLALSVAVKARRVNREWLKQLIASTWRRMYRRPLQFLVPIGRGS